MYLPAAATVALAAIVAALAGVELAAMAVRLGARASRLLCGGASATVAVAFVLNEHPGAAMPAHPLVLVLLTSLVAVASTALSSGPPTATTFLAAASSGLAPLYVGLPIGALADIRVDRGIGAFVLLFVILTVSDSAQYYTGRLMGKRKLAPSVSPAKTVEGALGGLIAATIAGGVLGPRVMPALTPLIGAAGALLLAASGIVGDLFESLLKRSAGVKDSSALIPGHGGVLDRIDSYLVATPVYFVLLRLVA